MKIVRIEATPITLPLAEPLIMAIATVTHRESLVVRVYTDEGVTGIGEGVLAPYFTGETPASAKAAVEKVLAPALLGVSVFDLNQIAARMNRVLTGNQAAKSAVDIACHDAAAKALGVPLYQLLGGKVRDRVPTNFHVSADDPERLAERATYAVSQGFRHIKLKVGAQDVKTDLRRLRAVREAVGDNVEIQADANQGWTPTEAIRFLQAAKEYELQFIEQPVAASDIAGMAQVVQAVSTPIAPDEGIANAQDVIRYVRAGAATGVVGKVIKTGGLSGLRNLASVAQAANLPLHLAGMPGESSISAAAEIHLAVSLPHLPWHCGITPHLVTRDVVTQPLRPVDGTYAPPEGPGIGVQIDEDALAAAAFPV